MQTIEEIFLKEKKVSPTIKFALSVHYTTPLSKTELESKIESQIINSFGGAVYQWWYFYNKKRYTFTNNPSAVNKKDLNTNEAIRRIQNGEPILYYPKHEGRCKYQIGNQRFSTKLLNLIKNKLPNFIPPILTK